MELPPEKLSELKQIIHRHLDQIDIHGRIRQCLSESMQQDDEENTLEEDGLLRTLKERGVIEEVMRSLNFKDIDSDRRSREEILKKLKQSKLENMQHFSSGTRDKVPMDPNKRHLYFQVLGGKAFLEHLQDPEPLPGRATSTFSLHIQFRGQRFASRPVACACEPNIQEGFLLELQRHSGDSNKMSDAPSLLTLCDKIHLVLIKSDLSGDKTLLSSHLVEWRKLLSMSEGRTSFSLELNGIGAESNVPVGVLDVKMELFPKLSKRLTPDVLSAQWNLEKSRVSERERLFLAYTKQWWREFLQIRASHSNRLVKIFAQTENGVHRLVCSFVQPLRAGRLLDTPRQAARFVSLLAFKRTPMLGGNRAESWNSTYPFLCAGKGDVECHAVLLCSLLLGFGMNAFVCIGTKAKGIAHSWVVTIDTDSGVLFWECLTAERFIHKAVNANDPPLAPQPRQLHPYKTIGCVFNHKEFYANCQPSENVDLCLFHLHNESLWKGMSLDAIKSVCGPGILPSPHQQLILLPSKIDPVLASNELENDLRALVVEHRHNMGMATYWDSELSFLLSPALASYEYEHSLGVSVGNEEFQHAIRRNVPDGHTFKGFPIQFTHVNARKAFSICLKSSVCEEIICCRGDHVKHAVRARVFTYPEDACAVWIMFCVKYKSIV
eukprot:gene18997-20909_t